jgi:hypothetical protein
MCTFSGNTGYTINYGKSIYVIDDSDSGTDGEVFLSSCALESDQSVYLTGGGSIVHHSGCAANTSLAGSGDRSTTVACTDSTSTWCPFSTLVADLLTNGSSLQMMQHLLFLLINRILLTSLRFLSGFFSFLFCLRFWEERVLWGNNMLDV